MHPILAARSRLALYVAAWVPLLALLALLSKAPGATWLANAGVLLPACTVFAFAALSPWYICRVLPIEIGEATRLATTWISAALCGGGLLAGTAWLAARLLRQPPPDSALLAGLGTILYVLSAGLHYTAIAAEASRAATER